jgi:hypothetical protein
MPIYDIFATKESEPALDGEPETEALSSGKDQVFLFSDSPSAFLSALYRRYRLGNLCLVPWSLISRPSQSSDWPQELNFFNHLNRKYWIALKRSGICGVCSLHLTL